MEQKEYVILDFSRMQDRASWQIINDGVMGGLSQSEMIFSEKGTAVFQGTLSLENNGGFASTRTFPRPYHLGDYSGLILQILGDGKNYQLRLRTDDRFDGISYRYHFTTEPGSTKIIRASFNDFEPVFRGQVVENAAPISPADIQQIGFLIANKQVGTFRLEVDWIKAVK
ncbi:MAG: CIA30 family protein [Desulforhopalus sp.]